MKESFSCIYLDTVYPQPCRYWVGYANSIPFLFSEHEEDELVIYCSNGRRFDYFYVPEFNYLLSCDNEGFYVVEEFMDFRYTVGIAEDQKQLSLYEYVTEVNKEIDRIHRQRHNSDARQEA